LIEQILVPIDGSEHADKALNYALDLADKYEASIEILTVVITPLVPGYIPLIPQPGSAWLVTYSKELMINSEKMLSDTLEKAKKKKPNLQISTKLVEGRPANKIVETAKEGNFDLIVLGSRGLSGITGFLLGSVSNRVSNDAACPVLIVK
jgi:nucleotide-binding universal stress UspA family protein